MKQFFGYVFVLACLLAVGTLFVRAGWQFCAGAFTMAVIYQVAHRVTYGYWLDFDRPADDGRGRIVSVQTRRPVRRVAG